MKPVIKGLSTDPILQRWLNPYYLAPDGIEAIRQGILAKPIVKYVVLDHFFRPEALELIIQAHPGLVFSEEQDRRGHNGEWLPYDGSVHFATDAHPGAELFFHPAWHRYCAYVTATQLPVIKATEIKLRQHRADADGFWIHTDSIIRSLVAICYFNRDWEASDGGLLQLWRLAEDNLPDTPIYNSPSGRLEFLTHHQRLRTSTPGGGFPDRGEHDLILLDQIVPAYNRMFFCNFQQERAYHSVTPSNGKVRIGMVQWFA